MNALDQVVRTIYQQRELYMLDNVVNPADFVVRVRVNHLTRDILRSCDDQYFYSGVVPDGQKETIVGGPLEADRDIPNDTYYLDLLVCNQVVKQLKFTLQGTVARVVKPLFESGRRQLQHRNFNCYDVFWGA